MPKRITINFEQSPTYHKDGTVSFFSLVRNQWVRERPVMLDPAAVANADELHRFSVDAAFLTHASRMASRV